MGYKHLYNINIGVCNKFTKIIKNVKHSIFNLLIISSFTLI